MDELRHRLMAGKKYGAYGLDADRMEPPLERFRGPPAAGAENVFGRRSPVPALP